MCNKANKVVEDLRGTPKATGEAYKIFLVDTDPSGVMTISNVFNATAKKIRVGEWYNFRSERLSKDNYKSAEHDILQGFCCFPTLLEASRSFQHLNRNYPSLARIFKIQYRRGICRKIENGMISFLADQLIVGSYKIIEEVAPIPNAYFNVEEQKARWKTLNAVSKTTLLKRKTK